MQAIEMQERSRCERSRCERSRCNGDRDAKEIEMQGPLYTSPRYSPDTSAELFKAGDDLDAKDSSGSTPLVLNAKGNKKEGSHVQTDGGWKSYWRFEDHSACIEALLLTGAAPYLNDDASVTSLDVGCSERGAKSDCRRNPRICMAWILYQGW